ncbi:peptidoglycan-binding protein [Thermodesulforhabdus norvegica]|uniref:Chitosanase n=1 Tax=Thermodesulforhabdus norvegica TaxID=39841 RepID=A0A1I4U864_9BACT|nr:peptidoglycan-binding protein [Thermodesulforhabdus norvegica]SFM85095.1 chitosanase [Thermodesulforhabdus norvegica]
MAVSEIQKKTAQAIVNIFETGSPHGDYSRVTFHPNDPGHLTYGRSQTTLASGNLYLLIKDYCSRDDAAFSEELTPYLERLEARDYSLDRDLRFKNLLKMAGHDPVMQEVQDAFFDRTYWNPALRCSKRLGMQFALSVCLVYDSFIHGSWKLIKEKTEKLWGSCSSIGEKEWVKHYVDTRRNWLAGHSIPLLRKTVYRMDTFLQLIAEEKWNLELPLWIRGIRLDETTIDGAPLRVSAATAERRLLKLTIPYQRGEDVREVQEALVRLGYSLSVDGVFGPETDRCVRDFQKSQGLVVDGIVGPVTRAHLDLED